MNHIPGQEKDFLCILRIYSECVARILYTCRQQSEAVSSSSAMSIEALTKSIEEWAPETSGCGELGNLPEILAEKFRPDSIAEFERTLAAIFSAGAEV